MAVAPEKIQQFVYREARLMDERKFDDWLALWTQDAIYWVPCNEDDYDPRRHVSLIYDNRFRLEERIFRYKSPDAHAQDPPTRTRRVVSNIEVEDGPDGEITVYANFVVAAARRSEEMVLGGRTLYKLRNEADGLKMFFKKVMLVNNNEPLGNVTFLL